MNVDEMTVEAAVVRLHMAGQVRNRFPPGCRVAWSGRLGRVVLSSPTGVQYVEWEGGVGHHTFAVPSPLTDAWAYDLADAATRGCLLAMVEEATGQACWVSPPLAEGGNWTVFGRRDGMLAQGNGYADALGWALRSLALCLPGEVSDGQ